MSGMKQIVQSGRDKGVTAVVIALVISVLLGFAALAVDVGHTLVARNELQNVADGAALAGARMLGRLYECNRDLSGCAKPMPYDAQLTYDASADIGLIRGAVTSVGSSNQAGGKTGITINFSDITVGTWNATGKTLTTTMVSPDAVRVVARRDASANSPITTFLAGIMGINTLNLTARATAALTGLSTSGPGALPIPVAINKSWISTLPCNQNLTFHPSSTGICAAWHSYDGNTYKPSASDMKKMINAMTAGSYQSPATTAGVTKYDVTNGTLASLFTSTAIQDLFNTMKVKNDGILDQDTNPATWTASVAVYDDTTEGCSPNGMITVVGFATITITSVSGPPQSTIYGTVKCDTIIPGRGSGVDYGTRGSIPGLVQ